MSKPEYIKIPIPKWKWWQTALIIGFVIIVLKSDPNNLAKMAKELVVEWLLK